jgi:hypothetical protein
VERTVGQIASASHGVVTWAELLRAGITPAEIKQRLHTGALIREHRGVYRVGHRAPSTEARCAMREAGLPLPQTNRPAGTRRVDCRWPERPLTVELDSYRYHQSRHAWEQDRHREREAHARGDEFRRYTYGDVFERPQLMLAELRALLRTG